MKQSEQLHCYNQDWARLVMNASKLPSHFCACTCLVSVMTMAPYTHHHQWTASALALSCVRQSGQLDRACSWTYQNAAVFLNSPLHFQCHLVWASNQFQVCIDITIIP